MGFLEGFLMMEVQKLVLKNVKDFELKDIFDCGQCFRWNREDDGGYTGVIKQGVLNVRKDDNDVESCKKQTSRMSLTPSVNFTKFFLDDDEE